MARHDERALGELFSELTRDIGVLLRKELELATAEMTAKARIAAAHAATAAVGAALTHAGLLVFLAAVVIGLTRLGLEPWLSALIVAAATGLIGYVLIDKGITHLRRANVAPTQAIESIKESTTWTNKTHA